MSSQDEPRLPTLCDAVNHHNHQNQVNENDCNNLRNHQPQSNFNNNLNNSFKINLNNNNKIISNNNNNNSNRNGKLPHLSVINNNGTTTGQPTVKDDWNIYNGNENSFNNNDEEYKLENKEPWIADTKKVQLTMNSAVVKLNDNGGLPDKLAEVESLTGHMRIVPEENDESVDCGIGRFRPKWAQRFASTNVFLVVFVIAWMLQVNFLRFFAFIS